MNRQSNYSERHRPRFPPHYRQLPPPHFRRPPSVHPPRPRHKYPLRSNLDHEPRRNLHTSFDHRRSSSSELMSTPIPRRSSPRLSPHTPIQSTINDGSDRINRFSSPMDSTISTKPDITNHPSMQSPAIDLTDSEEPNVKHPPSNVTSTTSDPIPAKISMVSTSSESPPRKKQKQMNFFQQVLLQTRQDHSTEVKDALFNLALQLAGNTNHGPASMLMPSIANDAIESNDLISPEPIYDESSSSSSSSCSMSDTADSSSISYSSIESSSFHSQSQSSTANCKSHTDMNHLYSCPIPTNAQLGYIYGKTGKKNKRCKFQFILCKFSLSKITCSQIGFHNYLLSSTYFGIKIERPLRLRAPFVPTISETISCISF